jgi:hypothetical protein
VREFGGLPPLFAGWYRSLEVSPERELPKRLIVAVTNQRVLIFDSGGALDGRPQRIVDEASLRDVTGVQVETPWYAGGNVTWSTGGYTYRLKARSAPRGRAFAKALQAGDSGAA